MSRIDEIMTLSPVIPVLTVEDVGHARPIAEALVSGGLRVLEVTLRTPAGLDAIRAMSEVKGAIVGAGTVLNEADLHTSLEAGARFIVSPGLTRPFAEASIASGIPFLPGIATATDIMHGLDLGVTRFKFFPAMAAGGIPALKALSAPFPHIRFCPTGGISEATAPDWLALDSVLCVGGSWLVPKGRPDLTIIRANASRVVKSLAPAA